MKKSYYLLIFSFLICLSMINSGCDEDVTDLPMPEVMHDTTPYEFQYGDLPAPTLPDDNPLTVQGVELGRMLFYEKDLSKDGTQSCASCHNQANAFTDTMRFSIGVEGLQGKRQAMPIFNMAWHNNEFFWDGRAHLLRDQALLPIQDPLEMNETLNNVVSKLSNEKVYQDQFLRAFGSDEINTEKIALALEQFMLSITSYNSKFDSVKMGLAQFTPSELRGRALFNKEFNPFFPEESGADCQHCHGGPNFENDQYMNNGLDSGPSITDVGRGLVTDNPMDRGKFKVPSLRNIELTAPYMHDGRFHTLEEVIDHYNEGIRFSPTLDLALNATINTGLMLDNQDKQDLIAFLKTLTDHDLKKNSAYTSPF